MRYVCNSLLLCGIAFLWTPAADAQDVAIQRVTDHVITLSMTNLGMHTNVTVIETQKGLVVVETEMAPFIMRIIKEAAETELGRKDWAYVINTHQHLHHAGGNGAFPDAQIIGHERMSVDWVKHMLSTDRGRRGYCGIVGVDRALRQLRQTLTQAGLMPAQRETLRKRCRFCEALKQDIMAGFEVRNPTITFDEHYELDMGDIHLRLTDWGPGINHGSLFVHVVEDNLIVGMNTAGKWIPGFLDDKPSLEEIRRMISIYEGLCDQNFPIDVMIKIHEPGLIRSRQRFQQTRLYFQTMLDDLTQAQQDGFSLKQAKAEFSLNKRHAHFCRDFPLPELERREKNHQKTIDTIWELLQKEELTARSVSENPVVRPESRRQFVTPTLLLAPVDWCFEAMPLPPRFAPRVKWTGFEEIRFAPGVFDNSSPNYFSYVIALSVNGTSAIDAAGIKDFLETYFRGLLPAVGQRKGLTVNAAQIVAEIAPAQTKAKTNVRCQGTVAIIDTFTDGRKTTLNVEADVLPQEGLKKTHVLLLLSPRNRDSKIWKTLRSIRDKTIASSALATAIPAATSRIPVAAHYFPPHTGDWERISSAPLPDLM